MQKYASGGLSFDLEENEERIRCAGVPVGDETGTMKRADAISRELGWASEEVLIA